MNAKERAARLENKVLRVPCGKAVAETLDEEKRTVEATITSDRVDRDGEIVRPEAFKDTIGTFLDNPVVLWMHDPRTPPIGAIDELEIREDRIDAKPVRFRESGKSQLADDLFDLVAQGMLRKFSIGFRVLPGGVKFEQDDDGNDLPPEIVLAELLEVSLVTVPSNVDAGAKDFLRKATILVEAQARHGAPGRLTSRGKTVFAPLDERRVLDLAPEVVFDVRRRLAKGEEVDADLRKAVERLRVALLGLPGTAPRRESENEDAAAKALEAMARELEGAFKT